ASAGAAPGNDAIVGHEAAHAQFAADLVVEVAGLFEVVGAHRDVADHALPPSGFRRRSLAAGRPPAQADSRPCRRPDRWLLGRSSAGQAVQGSACATPFALLETGASPITSASARKVSFTPSPVAPDISSGVFLAARFNRSRCFFNSSGVTASILFSATISIFSASCSA